MLRSTLHAVLVGALCGASGSALAANLRVPQQYPTIQGALDAAADGDTVIVAPGTYVENLNITRPVTLRSSAGAESTIIDGGGIQPVIVAIGTGAEAITIAGFTITNGFNSFTASGASPAAAAGIVARFVTIAIRDNIVRNNDGCIGNGISTLLSAATIQHNQIVDNTRRPECDGADGGGIFLNGSGAGPTLVANNVIARHTIGGRGAGIAVQSGSDMTIRDNLIADNHADSPGGGLGGGLLIGIANATIVGNTFVGNSAQTAGALSVSATDPSGRVVVQQNQFVGNQSDLPGSAVNATIYYPETFTFSGNVINGDSPNPLVYCTSLGSYAVARSNLLRNASGPLVGGGCTP